MNKAKFAVLTVSVVAVAMPTNSQVPLNASSEQAAALVRSIELAYRGIQTVELQQELFVREPQTGVEQSGGWRRRLLFNRERASFRLDDWHNRSSVLTVITVCNGQKMWHRSSRQEPSERVMEVRVSTPTDYYALVSHVPSLRGDWSPILALLMGEDLTAQIQWAFSEPDPLRVERLDPDPNDPRRLVGANHYRRHR